MPWKKDTENLSNVHAISRHPYYQSIIKMGQPAVTLILADLKANGPHHWFVALTSITGLNPIKQEFAGQMQKMTDAWLELGREKGWLGADNKE